MNISGGCLCGAVTYHGESEPVFMVNCHCKDCQKTSGSGYAAILFVPADAVKIVGEVKYFESAGGSGKTISRGFCPTCGSQLFGKPESLQGLLGVRAGTLDDASQYHPKTDIFTDHAASWDVMLPHTTKFPQAPSRA
jgi:hypothetical protein